MSTNCYTWSNLNLPWINVNWTWDECQTVNEIVEIVGSGSLNPNEQINDWVNKDKKRSEKVIRLVCKVKGYSKKKLKSVNENAKVTIKDIQLIVKAVKNIDLRVEIKY